MGREVWRMRKGFEWPLRKTWWGFVLPALVCKPCDGEGCVACEGEGKVWSQVEPPGYRAGSLPSWFCVPNLAAHYGWQMWENVSDGSPISPVCDTPESLATWLSASGASAFGDMKATRDEWLAMIHEGSAPSVMLGPKGMVSGVEAVGRRHKKATP